MKAFKQCTAIKQCRTPQNMFLPSRHTFPKSLTGKQEQGLADDLLGLGQPLSILWQLPCVIVALKQGAGNDSNRVGTAKTKG